MSNPQDSPILSKVLIANRGEIAVRIIRALHALGLDSVAVYSDADRNALHVKMADEAVYLGPAPATESYLNQELVLAAARRSGADAIHPGYGFLAENALFASACQQAGLIFIGPAPDTIARMGSKIQARQEVEALGLPVIPARLLKLPITAEQVRQAAAELGYPLLIKASAGGGGRGMRLIQSQGELMPALASAQREARQAFGDDSIYLEKYLPDLRHIEFQILGDQAGNLLHLFERECSLQRRYQKIIEEAPSPSLSPALRARMADAALQIGKALNYSSAGTVEFVLEPESEIFYFLEVNTRLQVEHPVTEAITGIDLVQAQIRIAQGQALPWQQSQVQIQGHAIECRLNAEDPQQDYLPVSGVIQRWQAPPGIRCDSGIQSGDRLSIFYDAMLAKLISHAPTRSQAIQELQRALGQTVLLGIQSNLDHLQSLLAEPDFQHNRIHTAWLSQHPPQARSYTCQQRSDILAVAWASFYQQNEQRRLEQADLPAIPSGWRNNAYQPASYRLNWQAQDYLLSARRLDSDYFQLEIKSASASVSDRAEASHYTSHRLRISGLSGIDPNQSLRCEIDGLLRSYAICYNEQSVFLQHAQLGQAVVSLVPRFPAAPQARRIAGAYCASMPAKILSCLVSEGQLVDVDQPLVVMESMKMETTLYAHQAGQVTAVWVKPGDLVEARQDLLQIRPRDEVES